MSGVATEFRTIDRHGHNTLDLERSTHPEGVAWRSWRLVGGALPARIAELRRDWGNGLITEDQCRKGEREFVRSLSKKRTGSTGAARRRAFNERGE